MHEAVEERRRFPRVAESFCAWVSFSGTSAAYSTLTLNVGTGGAQLSALRRVRVGEQVSILLQLQGGEIECHGEVCWTKPTGRGPDVFGVQFLDLMAGEPGQLDRLVVRRAPMSACA